MVLDELQRAVCDAVPGVRAEHLVPLRPTGFHHVDFRIDGRLIVVKWRDDIRFQIAEVRDDDDNAGFDSVPGVDVATVAEAIAEVVTLLTANQASAAVR